MVVGIRDLQKHIHCLTPQHYVGLFGRGGLPHFKGTATQRGNGFLSDLARYVMPVLSKVAPHALRAISGVIGDIQRGKKIGPATKKRTLKALKRSAKSVLLGKGKKAKKRKPPQKKAKTRKPPAKKRKASTKNRKTPTKKRKSTKKKPRLTRSMFFS